ncbi:aminotransferase class V-fold PLP-dependent enzyme [Pseudomonas sp. SWI6]|uniref:Aminotransferase class V-fold PLP-dependent enzyme n=1 Tax=Pseudomonas taiwanensis TaxID=470150 RepID=A0ABR6VEF3_9PSED|nr:MULTISPECIES: aminotransferase class V-fold PLP-dependent enzyme [Pseudomonas]AVD84206.1 aminotransferase class V-fold PLP-dependent enzyme [Pseudomonas sp. SWI6]AVD86414.1 aminotransferase class V-fold PLP-dependent enzyme [Pseudomonas sp. SWI44]MBC3478862.1 aminotransferase class V-fold PLP-dependent enzyme [Pseudomonas taiwanensis]MBC3492489.1 aminotransferase class V-fold PLP-dependent enzyme [Pseudomonas taiwanensis]QQZ37714.1 aminotransferase class V-fold PLP-dependent enzyme [Pseudom
MSMFHDEFDQSPGLRYLNHAAVAPWPRRASHAVARFAQENVAQGASDYPAWLATERRLRERLARLLNAPSRGDIALVKNTSEALSLVAFGLDWQPGDQVVISDEEFPSNRVVWEALADQGVEVVQVSLAGADPEAALLNACGRHTRLLAISAVQFGSGLRLDLERLGEGCQARQVLFCIDAIQQIGALPFDVQAYQCDFAMADGHKWMLGPEGLGVFYCRAALRPQLRLNAYGWHMLEHLGDFERRQWQPARSARRFECGSPNMLGACALEASLSLLEDVGMEKVARLLGQRVDQLYQGLAAIPGVCLHTPAASQRRAGIVTISLKGRPSTELYQALSAERTICALRGGGVRFSPHFYTDERLIDETIQQVRRLAMR